MPYGMLESKNKDGTQWRMKTVYDLMRHHTALEVICGNCPPIGLGRRRPSCANLDNVGVPPSSAAFTPLVCGPPFPGSDPVNRVRAHPCNDGDVCAQE
jgi:hypothetical protein